MLHQIPALMEPIAVPLIPVSGIAEITAVGGGQVVVTYFQKVPDIKPHSPGIEHHVAVRLQWAPDGIHDAARKWALFLMDADWFVPVKKLTN